MSEYQPPLEAMRNEAQLFTHKLLEVHGISPEMTIEPVRDMAWSSVARVRHEAGIWYLKALPPRFHHELELSRLLSDRAGHQVAEFIGMEPAHGLLMVADAGPMFRSYFEQHPDPSIWLEVLPAYAQLQISLMHDTALTQTGLPHRPLDQIPQWLETRLEDFIRFNGADEADQCRAEHLDVIQATLKKWSALIEPLYQFGISDTLHHGDLHDGNLAYQKSPVLFDWGDASLTHPFMSLRSVLGSISRRFNISETGSAMQPFIDAYLQPWQSFAALADLRQMVDDARRVWALLSLQSWAHAIYRQDDVRAAEYRFALPSLLREFADQQSIGRG